MTAPLRRELAETLFLAWDKLAGSSLGPFDELGEEARPYWFDQASAILPILTRELARARAEEREGCAAVLTEHYARHDNRETGYHEGARDALDIAEQAIRALGDEPEPATGISPLRNEENGNV